MRNWTENQSNLPLSDEAKAKLKEHLTDLAIRLASQAQQNARDERLDTVSTRHVDDAFIKMVTLPQRRWWKTWALFLGGTITGSALMSCIDGLLEGEPIKVFISGILTTVGIVSAILGGMN